MTPISENAIKALQDSAFAVLSEDYNFENCFLDWLLWMGKERPVLR